MRAVVFGAGRLGCGLVGQALHAAGHEVVLVSRDPATAAHLDRAGGYRVRLVEGGAATTIDVSGVTGLALADRAAVTRAVAEADLVATSVGAHRLDGVAPALADGVRARGTRPLDVLAFENGEDPAGRLAALVGAALEGVPHRLGVAGVLAERIVSRVVGDVAGDEPRTFVADAAPRFVVDATRLVTELPHLPGMVLAEDFAAWVARKLSVFSAGHVAAAYLGALKGYRYVHAAVRDAQVRTLVAATMAEGQAGLAARYGAAVAGGSAHLEQVLRRFANAGLDDPVHRVAREPLRKLAAGERIVGTAVRAAEAGVRPEALATVAAAALCFFRRTGGTGHPAEVLSRVSGLDAGTELGASILTRCTELSPGVVPGNALLDLERRLWAVQAAPSSVVVDADTDLEVAA
jgi:mannitol-1-phosphate 5-dehydrogenase